MWCYGSILAQNAKDGGFTPIQGTLFPIFFTPTTHILVPIIYILYVFVPVGYIRYTETGVVFCVEMIRLDINGR